MSTPASSTDTSELDAFLWVFKELARKAVTGEYIYRGEHAVYDKVSSSLYRRYKDIDEGGTAIETIQEEILKQALAHDPGRSSEEEEDTLAELRHNGGETNVIDFTKDYLIALFFACDGKPDKPGRIHLLPMLGEGYSLYEPVEPSHRVTAQKSILVRPDRGFVQPEETVTIEAKHKPAILERLRTQHGISSATIYNDLFGVIQHQAVHRRAYDALYKGVASVAKEDPQGAVEHYNACIRLNPQMAIAYNNRAEAYHELEDYDSAVADYLKALTFDPRNEVVYHNLGVAHVAKGQYRPAVQYFNQALQLKTRHLHSLLSLRSTSLPE